MEECSQSNGMRSCSDWHGRGQWQVSGRERFTNRLQQLAAYSIVLPPPAIKAFVISMFTSCNFTAALRKNKMLVAAQTFLEPFLTDLNRNQPKDAYKKTTLVLVCIIF